MLLAGFCLMLLLVVDFCDLYGFRLMVLIAMCVALFDLGVVGRLIDGVCVGGCVCGCLMF